MNKTSIEWVKNPDGTQGFTLNSKTGCFNNCPYCYARKESYGRCKWADLQGYPYDHDYSSNSDPWKPRWHPRRLEAMKKRKKPSGIFLNDRSDWAADYWPNEWTELELDTVRQCPQHRIYLLTKQPQNLIKFSPFPDNCWVGVTTTNQDMYDSAVYHLKNIKAKIIYISIEPFLSHIHLPNYRDVDWLIIGGQTQPTIYPQDKWVREIEERCDNTNTPLFEKNNLYPTGFSHLLRQEMPDGH